jgi:hypothetical protein
MSLGRSKVAAWRLYNQQFFDRLTQADVVYINTHIVYHLYKPLLCRIVSE